MSQFENLWCVVLQIGGLVSYGGLSRESCELRPPESCHSQSFEAHPPCSSILGWCRNDWTGPRMTGWETGWPLRGPFSSRHSWSSPVIPNPSLSFRRDGDKSHSKSSHIIPGSFLAMGWGIFKDYPTDHDIYAWNAWE